MALNLKPFTPNPVYAAYIGLVVALCALGFSLGALGAALTVR